MRQPNFFQVIEARIALALAKAAAAAQGIASLAHHTSVVNGSPVGPSATIAFAAPSFTPVSGKVLVIGTGVIVPGGGTQAAGDIAAGVLTRDGVAIPGSASPFWGAAAEGGTPTTSVMGIWIDTVTANTAHVWAIQALVGGGHTGAFSAGQASVTLIELP